MSRTRTGSLRFYFFGSVKERFIFHSEPVLPADVPVHLLQGWVRLRILTQEHRTERWSHETFTDIRHTDHWNNVFDADGMCNYSAGGTGVIG